MNHTIGNLLTLQLVSWQVMTAACQVYAASDYPHLERIDLNIRGVVFSGRDHPKTHSADLSLPQRTVKSSTLEVMA